MVRNGRQRAVQQLGFAFATGCVVRPTDNGVLGSQLWCMSGVMATSLSKSRATHIFGLPFGQDRLVPVFLATLAVRQQSQTIRFRSAGEMLDTSGMAKGGKEYRRLVAAFGRIFGATILFFGTESTGRQAHAIQRSRFNFLHEAQI
jgi:hypothetical protein